MSNDSKKGYKSEINIKPPKFYFNYLIFDTFDICVCVRERERERERDCCFLPLIVGFRVSLQMVLLHSCTKR